jgi:hypothetical protein
MLALPAFARLADLPADQAVNMTPQPQRRLAARLLEEAGRVPGLDLHQLLAQTPGAGLLQALAAAAPQSAAASVAGTLVDSEPADDPAAGRSKASAVWRRLASAWAGIVAASEEAEAAHYHDQWRRVANAGVASVGHTDAGAPWSGATSKRHTD